MIEALAEPTTSTEANDAAAAIEANFIMIIAPLYTYVAPKADTHPQRKP
jgi:hypothetical protein